MIYSKAQISPEYWCYTVMSIYKKLPSLRKRVRFPPILSSYPDQNLADLGHTRDPKGEF